jgi:thiamine biosynthesis protein ThiC
LVIGIKQRTSVGANIGMIFMMAVEQEYDRLNMAIKMFQDTMMRSDIHQFQQFLLLTEWLWAAVGLYYMQTK